MSSLKITACEIVLAGRDQQVEGEPLLLEAHHRRGDRDAARLNAIQSARTRRRDAGKTTLTENLLLFGAAIQLVGEVKARDAVRVLINLRQFSAMRGRHQEVVLLGRHAPGIIAPRRLANRH